MAANKIIGNVIALGRTTGQPDTNLDVVVRYYVTGQLTGKTEGQAVFSIDMTLNDTQIVTAIQTALAAFVDPLVFPNQGFAAVDVRGCSV